MTYSTITTLLPPSTLEAFVWVNVFMRSQIEALMGIPANKILCSNSGCSHKGQLQPREVFIRHNGKRHCKQCEDCRRPTRELHMYNMEHKLGYPEKDALHKITHWSVRRLFNMSMHDRAYKGLLMGCSRSTLREHFRPQLRALGRNYNNYKGLECDHIIPVSLRRDNNLLDALALSHYSNLRLIPRMENQLKGDDVPENFDLDTWVADMDQKHNLSAIADLYQNSLGNFRMRYLLKNERN